MCPLWVQSHRDQSSNNYAQLIHACLHSISNVSLFPLLRGYRHYIHWADKSHSAYYRAAAVRITFTSRHCHRLSSSPPIQRQSWRKGAFVAAGTTVKDMNVTTCSRAVFFVGIANSAAAAGDPTGLLPSQLKDVVGVASPHLHRGRHHHHQSTCCCCSNSFVGDFGGVGDDDGCWLARPSRGRLWVVSLRKLASGSRSMEVVGYCCCGGCCCC